MATISVTTPKDLIAMPVLATGAGAVIPLVAGPFVAGAVAGLANIDTANLGHMTALNVATKLGLGAIGTFVAKQPGVVGQLGLGMAIGGLAGALADAVLFGIAYATPVATTGQSPLQNMGYRLVRGGVRGRQTPFAQFSRGTVRATGIATSGLEILPRD